jgi:hypothetical protein
MIPEERSLKMAERNAENYSCKSAIIKISKIKNLFFFLKILIFA